MFKKILLLTVAIMLCAGTANARWTSSITFEGDVKNDYETTLQMVEPTQDNIVTVPDATGYVGLDLAEVSTATNTLTSEECGKTIFLNASTEFATTLPAVSTVHTGCEFTFVTQAAAAAANYTVLTGNSLENLIEGSLVVADALVACADEDTLTFVDANSIGDYVKLMYNGADWHIVHSRAETTVKLTCTQAD